MRAAVAHEVAAGGEDAPTPSRVEYFTGVAALEQAWERLRAGPGESGADAAAVGGAAVGGFANLARTGRAGAGSRRRSGS